MGLPVKCLGHHEEGYDLGAGILASDFGRRASGPGLGLSDRDLEVRG